MPEGKESPFACVDPAVGRSLWRLGAPDLDPRIRADLAAHVAVCHACAELVQLDAAARGLAREGRFATRPRRWDFRTLRAPRTFGRPLAWPAGVALATCLAAAVLSPPRPVSRGEPFRAGAGVHFVSPVEGEVVGGSRPVFRWTPVDGAAGYRVDVRAEDGSPVWSGESSQPELRLPEGATLAAGRSYRAILSSRPADLLAPGEASVAFRCDSLWRALLHRLRWSQPWLQGVGAVAFGVLVIGLLRRSPSPV